jgi:putative aldouronate transport system permease protein
MSNETGKKIKLSRIGNSLRQQKYLQLMVLPGLIWLIVFCYIPMVGLFAAFFDYNPFLGILKSPFVGFAHFKELFHDELFWNSVRNMFGLSLTKTVFAIIMPILFALMLNEIKNMTLKKIVQTASYLPHFISWVVVAGLFIMWLNTDGIVNHVLMSLGFTNEPQAHLNSPGGFWIWMAIIDTWKETGWWAIIYLAAIAAIPVEQYESAVVDGASRIRRMISITIPSIKSTIMMVVILSIGSMIYGGLSGSNLQQSLLFGNSLNYDNSMILETYIVNMGLSQGRFSYAIAAGLILSLLSFVLFSGANAVSRKLTNTSLY